MYWKVTNKKAIAKEMMFKIGISKERVMALKQHFVEIGRSEGIIVGKVAGSTEGKRMAKEEAMKFCYEEGTKAGIAAARKRRAANEKAFGDEGAKITVARFGAGGFADGGSGAIDVATEKVPLGLAFCV